MTIFRDTIHASALAALPDIGSNGALPADIQVFPPGKGVKFTLQDFPGQEFEMDVDASVAAKANADLQNLIARANAGLGAAPFADKNHEDAEKTFTPLRYFWGGDDPIRGGVRVVPDWTPFGAALVKAKAFSYFSGNFLFSKAKKKFLGLINENIGGLVNRPGFATQAAYAHAAPPTTPNQLDNMTPEQLGKIIGDALQPICDKVNSIVAQAKSPGAGTVTAEGADGFVNEVTAAQAKGMTWAAAAQEVSLRRPDLAKAYRNAITWGPGSVMKD